MHPSSAGHLPTYLPPIVTPHRRCFHIVVIFFIYIVLFPGVADAYGQTENWQSKGVLSALKDEHPQVRAIALESIESIHPKARIATIPALIEQLIDEDKKVRARAARALLVIGDSAAEAVPALIKRLTDEDIWVKRNAARALGAMGESAANSIPVLINHLGESEPWAPHYVAQALGDLGESAASAVPELIRHLEGEKRGFVLSAAYILGRMGDSAAEAVPTLIKLLNNSDSEIQRHAAEALGMMGNSASDAIPTLIELLNDEFSGVRQAAAYALETMGESAADAVPALIECLSDDVNGVRRAAASALGAIGKPASNAVPALIERLSDNESLVRSDSAYALALIGELTTDTIPALIELLRDRSGDVQRRASSALGLIGNSNTGVIPILIALLEDSNSEIREGAARALGTMGKQAINAVPALIKRLGNDDIFVQFETVKALGLIGEQNATVPALLKQLNHSNSLIRTEVITALTVVDISNAEVIQALIKRLSDSEQWVRGEAAQALGELGESAAYAVPALIANLKNDDTPKVRKSTIEALAAIGKSSTDAVPVLIEYLTNDYERPFEFSNGVAKTAEFKGMLKITNNKAPDISHKMFLSIIRPIYKNVGNIGKNRFLAHFLTSGEPVYEQLLSWIAKPYSGPPVTKITNNHQQAIKSLQALHAIWPASESFPEIRKDIEEKLALVVREGAWSKTDIALLNLVKVQLDTSDSLHSATIEKHITKTQRDQWLLFGSSMLFAHATFWLVLITLYPRSVMVQSIFFWNPWIRRFIGLGYIGLALTWIPYLRNILFKPFLDSLLADADLDNFKADTYFRGSQVLTPSGNYVPITEAIPQLHGQFYIEGESGLGKSMYLRYLAKSNKRVTVFLPATKCTNGVLDAIRSKLHGPTKDPIFLRNVIYTGGVNICIDGLNEVSADTREKISTFAESYFKGNIIMTTQPLEWSPPTTVKRYIIQPLARELTREFLLSQYKLIEKTEGLHYGEYEQACQSYLNSAYDEIPLDANAETIRRILSNPMDLTIVAIILAQEQQPDVFHLHSQQYKIFSEDYKRINFNQEFPLALFSEYVYKMRLENINSIPEGKWNAELECMARHKMTILRQTRLDNKNIKTWHFRHDKIIDFFIVKTFLGIGNQRPCEHMGDPRFRGVYLMLALLLPVNEAKSLREMLINYAADSKDHTVSDSFIKLLRSRIKPN